MRIGSLLRALDCHGSRLLRGGSGRRGGARHRLLVVVAAEEGGGEHGQPDGQDDQHREADGALLLLRRSGRFQLGGTALGDDGAQGSGSRSVIEQLAPEAPDQVEDAGQSSNLAAATEAELREEIARREAEEFASAAASLRQAMQDMPELAELSRHLIIDQTPEGLRIQLVDQEGRSMFDNNSAQPNERARVLLRAVSRVINQLPNRVTVTGHTSAVAGQRRASAPGDWSLSSSRADASRQILQGAGVDPDRVYQVSGKAGSDPLYPDDPTLAGNRRIAIVLLREAPVLPSDTSL